MKFPEYSNDAAISLRGFRQAFSSLAGPVDSDAVYDLLCYLASAIAGSAADKPLVVAIAGAQGTGKSTMTRLLSSVLSECMNLQTATVSLDDFYLPASERRQLAMRVHPLLSVRGVPGTHDIDWLQATLQRLRLGQSAQVPVFSKGEDDRQEGMNTIGPAKVILCEGWCWGAVPEPADRLENSVNLLERDEDHDGVWRRYVNQQLLRYQPAFVSDALIFFKAPSIDAVIRWRTEQEQGLARAGGGSKLMSATEVKRFVGFYERITRWMLEEVPGRAGVTVSLGEDHALAGVTGQ